MESKALEKSTNDIVAFRFFAHTPSRIQRIVKICDIVDRFLRKPFWFFLSIFSILGSMRLHSRALYILTAIDVRVISQLILANPRLPFLGIGKMHPFVHLSIVFWLYISLQCRSSMSLNFLIFHTSGGYSSSPATFLSLIFLSTEFSSSCVNCPSLTSNWLLIILMIDSCVTFEGLTQNCILR